ncbi:hypothetical protein COY14_02670 [Candidatus Roizmanbacteria bacterium CG_4_10_14_0_2_um_filter_36_9]|uniref:Uncharacterized protein n=1 Tax=Candidatus Roizmanbacteria bacterium CG_4_10_14_0_2_um_filter_36_9 TaxID=1974823 RepID=A0A2M7U4D2_9BACT|nr:MAG: hypothetical protein COY14_02670 [Candidatus Roizmanbacteria bacterium CG_4_10_14_0_2_um_filter_36_9]
MNPQKIFYIVIGGIILVLLVAAIYFFTLPDKASSETRDNKDSVFEEPREVIPTVDSSVKVTIKGKTEAVIELSGIPDGTKEIEYELSYNTSTGSIEGVFGLIEVDGSTKASEDVTFGTCSSGVCRYHAIEGEVSGTFKFSGSYGEKLLESTFNLDK